MANQCQRLDYKYPVTSENWRIQPREKQEYAAELLAQLREYLATIQEDLENWNFTDFTPVPPEITIPYPTFDDFLAHRPEPIDPKPNWPLDVSQYRPEFIDIDPVPVDGIPEYDVTNYIPDFPPRPDDNIPSFTEEVPDINTNLTFPTAPVLNLPADPVTYLPTIPEVPQFSFTAFDAEDIPVYNFPEPATTVNPGDLNYGSTLNDAVKTKLEHDVRFGGTGLADVVEDAIWRREEERSLIAHYEAMAQIADEFGRKGYMLPPQMLSGALAVEKTNYVNKRLDTSRDIAIKQAELAQANTHFAIEQSNAYERMMIEHFDNFNMRVFEASKATVGFGIEVYKANIERYNTLVNWYKVRADVWKTLIDAEVAKLQGYLAQIEGAKMIVEIGRMNVEVYRSKVDALNMLVNMYKTEMEAAKVRLEAESLKIDLFKSQVDAFAAQINAVTAKFNLYGVEVDAEKARIGAWATQVDTYKARVEAAKVAIDAHAARINAQADTNKSLASVYGADVDAYKAMITGEASKVESEVRVYEGEVRGYEADARAYEALGNLSIKVIDQQLQEYKIENDVKIEYLKLDAASYLDLWKIKWGVMETEAQVMAQVAAAALNADSMTTHLSESHSFGNSNQVSCVDQHYYEETTV